MLGQPVEHFLLKERTLVRWLQAPGRGGYEGVFDRTAERYQNPPAVG